jgi:transcriptional regulator with XRE-family HTH domain
MPIAAQFEETPQPAGAPRAPRRTLRLEAQGELASGAAAGVLVHNISATGLLLETDAALAVGEVLEVDLPQAGATRTTVVWTSDRLFGCRFDAPISPGALSAAQLRGAVGGEIAIEPRGRAAAAGEGFSARLQRLRKERGLSLGQIAARLGVSKPTVWAWEKGKARPTRARLEALAELFEIPAAQLQTGRDASALPELLARSREQIAEAVGAAPEQVKILIEL